MGRPGGATVATYAPDGTDQRWLGRTGYVTGLTYSTSLPGGADQMSCTLQVPPSAPRKSLEPGRIVGIYRGAQRVWDGKMDAPQPTEGGWTVQAHGSGTFGGDFMAYWTTWNSTDAIDQAISRGLRWTRGTISGSVNTDTQTDSASVTLTDFLNNMSTPAGLVWQVGRNNILTVSAAPTTVSRLLVATAPVMRSLHGYYTRIYGRYQSAADDADAGTPATYGTTSVSSSAQAAKHGSMEIFEDLAAA